MHFAIWERWQWAVAPIRMENGCEHEDVSTEKCRSRRQRRPMTMHPKLHSHLHQNENESINIDYNLCCDDRESVGSSLANAFSMEKKLQKTRCRGYSVAHFYSFMPLIWNADNALTFFSLRILMSVRLASISSQMLWIMCAMVGSCSSSSTSLQCEDEFYIEGCSVGFDRTATTAMHVPIKRHTVFNPWISYIPSTCTYSLRFCRTSECRAIHTLALISSGWFVNNKFNYIQPISYFIIFRGSGYVQVVPIFE